MPRLRGRTAGREGRFGGIPLPLPPPGEGFPTGAWVREGIRAPAAATPLPRRHGLPNAAAMPSAVTMPVVALPLPFSPRVKVQLACYRHQGHRG